ncbi:MAG: 50S ribosomal protein L4 [Patescibacteria group bacterium]
MSPAVIKILNHKGEAAGELAWTADFDKVVIKPTVVHQVVVAYAANHRQGSAHTKNRSEVAGGGKKPWKQKGTGRARHGSIRSPIWVGGGVVFGPRNTRNYGQRLPDKLKSLATAMVIKDYFATGRVTVLADWPTDSKTKVFSQLARDLKLTSRRPYLALLTDQEKTIRRGLQNLPNFEIMGTKQFNVYDGLSYRHWVMSRPAAEELLKRVK